VWALQACLYTSPPRPARFNLEVVQERPEIIDLLVQCSQVKRPAWYPETQVDSRASLELPISDKSAHAEDGHSQPKRSRSSSTCRTA
jgi:hypothetical protein